MKHAQNLAHDKQNSKVENRGGKVSYDSSTWLEPNMFFEGLDWI